jgi:hypothetical protein
MCGVSDGIPQEFTCVFEIEMGLESTAATTTAPPGGDNCEP